MTPSWCRSSTGATASRCNAKHQQGAGLEEDRPDLQNIRLTWGILQAVCRLRTGRLRLTSRHAPTTAGRAHPDRGQPDQQRCLQILAPTGGAKVRTRPTKTMTPWRASQEERMSTSTPHPSWGRQRAVRRQRRASVQRPSTPAYRRPAGGPGLGHPAAGRPALRCSVPAEAHSRRSRRGPRRGDSRRRHQGRALRRPPRTTCRDGGDGRRAHRGMSDQQEALARGRSRGLAGREHRRGHGQGAVRDRRARGG